MGDPITWLFLLLFGVGIPVGVLALGFYSEWEKAPKENRRGVVIGFACISIVIALAVVWIANLSGLFETPKHAQPVEPAPLVTNQVQAPPPRPSEYLARLERAAQSAWEKVFAISIVSDIAPHIGLNHKCYFQANVACVDISVRLKTAEGWRLHKEGKLKDNVFPPTKDIYRSVLAQAGFSSCSVTLVIEP